MAVLQGAVIALYGVYLVITAVTSHAHSDPGSTAFGGGIVVVLGMLPLLAGRALLQRKRWGRSPAVMMDTLCLAVAYVALRKGGGEIPLGVAVGLFGVVGIVLLLHTRSTAALWPERAEEQTGGQADAGPGSGR
jgi:drug/metabolite transporter (DMT)-like permease